MAKKGAGKNRGQKKPKKRNKPRVQVAADADLRLIPQHIEHYINGVPEAAQALISLGRDAAFSVLEHAAETKNEDLEEFGRRLAATPPSLETNMDALRQQYFGRTEGFSRTSSHTFNLNMRTRLPNYKQLIQEVAAEYQLDWELLAAIAYQESHWNPKATSPTGVRGLMMLKVAVKAAVAAPSLIVCRLFSVSLAIS